MFPYPNQLSSPRLRTLRRRANPLLWPIVVVLTVVSNCVGAAAIGTPLTVNQVTNNMLDPAVAMNGSGQFVIAWQSGDEVTGSTSGTPQDGSGTAILARVYDVDGTPLTSALLVNSFTNGNQVKPDVAIDDTGNFVVVWASQNQDGDSWGIYAQRYSAAGTPLGGETTINTTTTLEQTNPAIAMTGSGDYLIVWSGLGEVSPGVTDIGIFGQRFDAAGQALGGEFRIDASGSTLGAEPGVAMDAGNIVVVWDIQVPPAGRDILAQVLDSSGLKQGGTIAVDTSLDFSDRARVALLASGDFLVAWERSSTPYIVGRRFDITGAAAGDSFNLSQPHNTPTDTQSDVAVAAFAGGGFVTAFSSLETEPLVRARRFGADSLPLENDFQVASQAQTPDVATDASDNFIVVWQQSIGNGNFDIVAQRYDTTPVQVEQGAEAAFPTGSGGGGGCAVGTGKQPDGSLLLLLLTGLAGGLIRRRRKPA